MLDSCHENDRILSLQSPRFGIGKFRNGLDLLDHFGGKIYAFSLKNL